MWERRAWRRRKGSDGTVGGQALAQDRRTLLHAAQVDTPLDNAVQDTESEHSKLSCRPKSVACFGQDPQFVDDDVAQRDDFVVESGAVGHVGEDKS